MNSMTFGILVGTVLGYGISRFGGALWTAWKRTETEIEKEINQLNK